VKCATWYPRVCACSLLTVNMPCQVDSRDDAYRWLMHWLAQHSSISRSRAVSVTTAMSAFGTSALPPGAVTAATDAATPSVHYLPAPGDHVLRYKGCWVWVRRQRASGNPQLASNAR
jgi:chaperone BCS1